MKTTMLNIDVEALARQGSENDLLKDGADVPKGRAVHPTKTVAVVVGLILAVPIISVLAKAYFF